MLVCTAVKDLERLQRIHDRVVPYLQSYVVGNEYRQLEEHQRRTRTDLLEKRQRESTASGAVPRLSAMAPLGSSIAKDTFRQVTGYNTASKRKRLEQGIAPEAKLR
jgi:hypothetical protein